MLFRWQRSALASTEYYLPILGIQDTGPVWASVPARVQQIQKSTGSSTQATLFQTVQVRSALGYLHMSFCIQLMAHWECFTIALYVAMET